MHELRGGQRVGRLEVIRELGRGAYGRVYLARDTLLGRAVALKLVPGIPEATEAQRARVLREARAAGRLTSPHVVALYDVHETPDGAWLLEMEYAEGGSLADLLATQPALERAHATRIARGIARGLAVAHREGIVHGDVKPGNIMLDRAGEAKLTDFGFARLADEHTLSTSARLEGTPTHMAPEVILGAPASPAADFWAFGVVLYRILTGRLPFESRDWPSLFFAVQHEEPPPPGPAVPADLARLALRCLAKRASDRPSSWDDVLGQIDGVPHPVAPAPAKRTGGAALLGRDREIAQIHEALGRAASGTGTCVVLTGATGIGMSTLAREARDAARRAGFASIETAITPLQGLARPLLDAARRWIEGGLAARLDENRFGPAGGVARRLLAGPDARFESHGQMMWVVEQLFRALAAEAPLAVLIEDAEAGGPEDVKAIRHLQLRLAESPILTVVTCATDRGAVDTPALLSEVEGIRRIEVGPLPREAAHGLLLRVADVGGVAPDVARRIHEVAQGNPLLTIELHRHLLDAGVIVREGDPASPRRCALVPGPAWGTEAFPRRLHEIHASRLAQLAEEDRVILDAAAADGILIDGDAIAALIGRPLLGVLRSLQRLYRETGLVVPGPTSYRFANAALREVIQHDLAPDLRRALHLDFARNLEARNLGERDPERIGLHWERAGEASRARPYLRRAAAAACARQEVARAIDLAARGGIEPGRITPAEALAEADLVLVLGDCYYGGGRAAEAESLLTTLFEATRGDDTLHLRALVRLAFVRYYRHGLAGADENGLRRAADELPPGREKGLAFYLLGIIRKFRGELPAAEAHLKSADAVFRACNLDGPHSSALDQLASIAKRQGRLREACALYDDAARIAAHAGRRPNAAASTVNAALTALALGRLEGLTQELDRAIAEFEIEGASNLAAHARAHLGLLSFSEGDLDAALEIVRNAAGTLERNDHLPGLAFATAVEAHILAIRGRMAEAEAALSRSAAAATKMGLRSAFERAAALRALMRAWQGDTAAAAAAAAEAVEQARHQGAADAVATLLLAEAAVYGGPIPALAESVGLLPYNGSEAALEPVAREVGAAIAAGAAATPASLRSAAAALRAATGEGRAALHAFGGLLDVQASVAEGDIGAAEVAAVRALNEARALAHAWLELKMLALLARIAPSSGYAARFQARLDEAAGSAGSDEMRDRIRASWTAVAALA